MKKQEERNAARPQNNVPCSVIGIAFRSARVIMYDIFFRILSEKSGNCKGHFEQKQPAQGSYLAGNSP
jgi:hypothetical protein